VRVEAERVDVQAVAGGKLINAQQRWDAGEPKVFSSTSTPTPPGTFAWSQINASAPARIVRATDQKTFQYAVLIDAAGLRWSGYTSAGGYLADAKGKGVKPLGG
jgi:uncharacterized iron-regulated membrane protein